MPRVIDNVHVSNFDKERLRESKSIVLKLGFAERKHLIADCHMMRPIFTFHRTPLWRYSSINFSIPGNQAIVHFASDGSV